MPKLLGTTAIATAATSAGTTGIVVQYGSLLVIDPILIVLGILGFVAAFFRYSEHSVANRVSGFIVGILLANFSSLGLAEFAMDKGLSFLNPHIAAVAFGFAGSSIIDLWEKWMTRKGVEITNGALGKLVKEEMPPEYPIPEESEERYYEHK